MEDPRLIILKSNISIVVVKQMFWLICWSLFSSKVDRDENGRPKLPDCRILYYENFSDPNVLDRWLRTTNFRFTGKWIAQQTYPLQTRRFEKAIVTQSRTASHAISTKFRHPISVPGEPLVIQFEARVQLLFTCASPFMTIFTDADFDPLDLSNETFRWIEFGPQNCLNKNQTHLDVFTRASDGSHIRHSLKRAPWIPVDEIAHLYTLIIRPDGTFEILVDNRSMRNGTFTGDFAPPIFDLPTIDDPNDKKPDDWVDDVLILDPNAVKPADWDDDAPMMIPDPKRLNPPKGWLLEEQPHIPDPKAKKPDTWNSDTMGEWQPPLISNPKCLYAPGCGPYTPPKIRNLKARGKWRAPYVPNPNYKGEWKPRQIPNPNYNGQVDKFEIPPITGIGFSVWSEYRDIAFTNVLIATNESAVKAWNEKDFVIRQRRQVRAMKISYNWINVDLPDDVPEPGVVGKLAYWGRCVDRKWKALKNKPVVITLSLTIVLVLLALIFFCWAVCEDDPFGKLKTE